MDWLVVSLERPFTIKIFKSGRLHLPTPGQPLGGGVGQRNSELFGSQSLRSRRVLIKVILGDFRGRLWSKDVNQHLQTTFLLLKFDPLLFPSVGIWPNLGYFNKYAKKRKLLFELQVLFRFSRSCLHFFSLPSHCFLCVKDLNVKKGNRSLQLASSASFEFWVFTGI